MKLRFFLFISFLIHYSIVYVQNMDFSCGADEVNTHIFSEHPELQSGYLRAKQQLDAFTKEYVQNYVFDKSGATYIIPVVFHVIHDYGAGNISDEQIYDAVKQVNIQLRKLNADTTEIVNDFKHLAADVEVEIRLAKIDPDGNCTNGITRTYSPLTNTGGHVVKSLVHWPPEKYLNIYVCNNVGPNLAGHALMPAVADTIPEWDGIVMQHSYIGSIGTSDPFKQTVLTHEIGHYLNLYHIWGGNNVPEFYYLPVGNAGNCAYDDEVSDTPNTIGWSSCNLSSVSCGSLDMVQNYMDYSYCHRLFTEGQKLRIHAALNSSVANRNNLWTNANLISTGVIDADNLCHCVFDANKKVICVGESVTFTDLSYHGITAREWTFQGGNITSSTDSTVTIVYSQPGVYDVSLKVYQGTETLTETKTDFIQVLDKLPTSNKLIENFESETNFANRWCIPENELFAFQRTPYGKDSDYSLYVDNFNGVPNSVYSIVSKPFDVSMYTKYVVSFDYAYAKSGGGNGEKLYFQVSEDCGETWVNKNVFVLSNTCLGDVETEFFPTQDEWEHAEKLVVVGTNKSNHEMIRFQFGSKNGNNFYMDNINIYNEAEMGLAQENSSHNLFVYPNPASTQFVLELGEGLLLGEVELYAIDGQLMSVTHVQNQSAANIDVSMYANGTYFVRYVSTNQEPLVRRIIVAK
ncbi:MAG: M43 family zinc metalloprotease [Brumimicrobium sp.]|nr:M43 family zinc metalloprotease [Brumimicrobium sp.]